MIESLLLIGSSIKKDEIIYQMIKPLPNENKGRREDVMMEIVFDLDKNSVDFEYIKLDEEVTKKYRYIGHTFRAAREPVARLTFSDTKHLYNKDGDNVISNIRKVIKEIKSMEEIESRDLMELDRLLEKIEQFNLQDVRSKVEKEIESKKKDYNINLFTVSIKKDNKIVDLATKEFYDTFLYLNLKYPSYPIDGICHLCGKEKVLADPAFESGSILKIYSKDKKGFISGISSREEDMIRTFAVCPDCRLQLIAGEKYIQRKLTLQIGNLNTFVIPRIGYKHEPNLIDRLADVLKGVTSFDGFEKLDQKIKTIEEIYNYWYTFTFIFGSKDQASFKLDYFLQEVPITNIRRFREVVSKVMDEATGLWQSEKRDWDLTLSGIARLYPLRRIGDDFERKPLIELISSILKIEPYDQNRLLDVGCLLAKIYRYELYDLYNITHPDNSDIEMCHAIVKFNYLLLLLKRLGMITNEITISNGNNIPIPDEKISKWIKTMNYDTLQTGLFILGYLIAQVGNAQYKKGDKKKSILDKLDFKGMKKEKVVTLINEMLSHLRNYRILEYNERYYYIMFDAINRCINYLDKDPIGNLFYILSGYAFGTYMAISEGGRI